MAGAETKRQQNRSSARQEARRAAETGGKVQPGSGCSWRRPQDVQTDTHLEQLKYTDADSYTIKFSEIDGLMADAMRDGREPRLIVESRKWHVRLIIEPEVMP